MGSGWAKPPPRVNSELTMPLYDAFISYSHVKDKLIAVALQSVVQRLDKPCYRRQALPDLQSV